MSLKINTYWSFIGSVAPMILGLITIPYLIKQVHVEAFGILTLVWSLIGYFSIFDFGIGRALTHQVSSSISLNLESELPSILKTGLLFMLATGVFGGVVLAISAHELGTQWLNVSEGLEKDTTKCLVIAAIGIPLTTVTSGLKGILEGYEDFKAASVLRIILGICNFGLPALAVMFLNNSLEYMVLSLVLARFIVMLAHLYVINKRLSIYDVMTTSLADKNKIKKLLSFGAWMTLSNIISPLMVTADRFIISYILGAGLVAYYTVPFDFIVRLLIIPAALTGVLFPRFSYLYKTDIEQINRLYKKSFFIIFAVMGLISFGIAIGSYFGLTIWLGKNFAEHSWVIASILAIGLLFNSLAQVPHTAIQASGDVKITSIIHLSEFIFYIPLLYGALHFYGLVGAAIVWVLRVFVDLIALSVFAKMKITTVAYV
ncbi:Membrane protein involved in the export of O-antigen and teichoic acid [Flavobacterium succinicans]|uniref:Membrane protein involved in the export of O-antigen and teichoic acid n=1 Tax=Flavobacterium succinicans TaxID=29536 RepID=A0A1I4SDH3_9FLAO|nr:flippase [Flavobacterium succinicans]SFM62505.1 Membrane protein involved in the export of O-antigen and teichoic acid [Flavobacterium succinicans]